MNKGITLLRKCEYRKKMSRYQVHPGEHRRVIFTSITDNKKKSKYLRPLVLVGGRSSRSQTTPEREVSSWLSALGSVVPYRLQGIYVQLTGRLTGRRHDEHTEHTVVYRHRVTWYGTHGPSPSTVDGEPAGSEGQVRTPTPTP